MSLFLSGLKPCVRIGKNKKTVYTHMKNWCKTFNFASYTSRSGYMYISSSAALSRALSCIDDSVVNHAEVFGLLLGYPPCCARKIGEIGEAGIDAYDRKLADEGYSGKFRIINSSGYTLGKSLISHVPCCTHCELSYSLAIKMKDIVQRYSSEKFFAEMLDFLNSCK